MNPFGIQQRPAETFAEFNAAQERARREYAVHPTAFAVDPMCETCQVRRRDWRSRKCWTCRKEARE